MSLAIRARLNPIVLAKGTYSGSLAFNTSSVNLVGNVFPASESATNFPIATIRTLVIVPEPRSIVLLGLMGSRYLRPTVSRFPLWSNCLSFP